MISYDELLTILKSRRSIRSYNKKNIEIDRIVKILEAAILAPSPTNSQGWRFRILQNIDDIVKINNAVEKRLYEIAKEMPDGVLKDEFIKYGQNFVFMKNASALLLCYSQKPRSIMKNLFTSKINLYKGEGHILSLGMAIQNMLLAATTLQLASCILTGPLIAEDEINLIFTPPARFELTALITLGYNDKQVKSPGRKSIEKFIIND